MTHYLTQILSDIRAAHRPEQDIETQRSLDEHFAEVEAWLAGELDGRYPFGWHCGLQTEQFPPPERLSQVQMAELVEAFDRMLYSWNIHTDIPEGVPVETAYRLLVSVLDRKVQIVSSGFVGIEFCNYEPETCPFGPVWCTCRETLGPTEKVK